MAPGKILCRGFHGNPLRMPCSEAITTATRTPVVFRFVMQEQEAAKDWVGHVVKLVTDCAGRRHRITPRVGNLIAWMAVDSGMTSIFGIRVAYPYRLRDSIFPFP